MLEKIGRFEIKREIGRGGMATVFLAFDPRFEREVAIKVLPRQFTHDPRFLARFEQEARTIAALEHIAIVPVYDFGEEDDAPYLVMRYMAGGSLRERMNDEALTLQETSHILQRLAPALDKAHRRGIIHRDMKPGNVLFDEDNQPCLADFGIARLAEATHTMTIVGTPAYMSPEQVRGQQKLDGRSDIYALGVMLFEMLSGCQPYEAETPSGQMFMHVMEPVPDVLAAEPTLPPQAQAVIEKAMAKDREERYQTAVEVAQAVRQLLEVSAAVYEPVVRLSDPVVIAEVAVESEEGMVVVPAAKLAETMVDTPPEEELVAAKAKAFKEENIARPVPHALEEETAVKGRHRPAWVWWAGAFILFLLLVFGIYMIFGTGDSIEPPSNPVLGSVWQRPQDSMKLLYVPPGTFSMGSDQGESNEQPAHNVSLDGFWIDETEVTNAQYVQCVNAGECAASGYSADPKYRGDNYPVVGVNWNDADTYCRWAGGQLPTEAQWEYVARGIDSWRYPWGEEAPRCDLAQYGDCGGNTVPVGSYLTGASWVGALDMAGNVWEMVNDWYDIDYYASSATGNPEGPASGSRKVLRGGGWGSVPVNLRGATRFSADLDLLVSVVGFRCALPAD